MNQKTSQKNSFISAPDNLFLQTTINLNCTEFSQTNIICKTANLKCRQAGTLTKSNRLSAVINNFLENQCLVPVQKSYAEATMHQSTNLKTESKSNR